MCELKRLGFIGLACLVLVPATLHAQASITGVVRDTSGALLPGVTVEATSPVLIERVRSVVTDGTGQYRIVELRPGTYTLTFSLSGFVTVRREGIELTGAFTATVNAELPVGTLQETVTVIGESPIVDVQNARRQQVIGDDVVAAIPGVRGFNAFVVLVPGITAGSKDVPTTPDAFTFTIHGGRSNEGRVQVDGLNIGASVGGGGIGGYFADVTNAQEMTFTTAGGLGEAEVGGPHLNIVPRAGSNALSGRFYTSIANNALQGSNFTQALRNAGLRTPDEVLEAWDVSGAIGGPIRRDKLWYFANLRYQGNSNAITGMYANKNMGDPTKWTYEPDVSRRARGDLDRKMANARLTWQVTPRNRISLFWDEHLQCSGSSRSPEVDGCRKPPNLDEWVGGGSATSAPEAGGGGRFGLYEDTWHRVQQATWTSPVTGRLLLEGGFGTYLVPGSAPFGREWPGNPTRGLIRVQEQAGLIPGLVYRSQNWSTNFLGAHTWRASALFVTGAHNLKFGYQGAFHVDNRDNDFTNDHRLSYRLNNGVPNQLTMVVSPIKPRARTEYAAFYAQEQWTRNRLTLQGALRYDHAWSYFPPQQVGPDRFMPVPLTFPETAGVKYHDITPRAGAAYDLFGDGRTAIKANLGKLLGGRDQLQRQFHRIESHYQRGHQHEPGLDRSEPRLRAQLRPDEPGDERRMRTLFEREFRHQRLQQHLRRRAPRGLGRASMGLAVRPVRSA